MHYIGITITADDIRAGVLDEHGNIYAKRILPHCPEQYDAVLDESFHLTERALRAASLTIDDIDGVGVATPGRIDESGRTRDSFNTPWSEADVSGDLGRLLGKKVSAGNDGVCGAVGEWLFGGGKNSGNMLYMEIGRGVACGIVCNGKPLMRAGIAPSHIVVNPEGRRCSCGNFGCLETYISTEGILRRTEQVMKLNPSSAMWKVCGGDLDNVTSNTAFECCKLGDRAASAVVEEFCNYLALGLADYINVFRPEKILLGGKIAYSLRFLLGDLRTRVTERVYGRRNDTALLPAVLGDDAVMMGAGMLGTLPG